MSPWNMVRVVNRSNCYCSEVTVGVATITIAALAIPEVKYETSAKYTILASYAQQIIPSDLLSKKNSAIFNSDFLYQPSSSELIILDPPLRQSRPCVCDSKYIVYKVVAITIIFWTMFNIYKKSGIRYIFETEKSHIWVRKLGMSNNR